MGTINTKSEILGLQFLKFICALFVIIIHFGYEFWRILIPICRIAVPIFFIITGYFLGYEIGVNKKIKLRNKIIRIGKLTLFAFCLYLIFSFVTCIHNPEKLKDFLNINYWIGMILFGHVPAAHLWYLISLLQSLGFIYICCNFKKTKWLYWLIPLGLTLNLLFGSYNYLLSDINVSNHLLLSRNTLTIGLPCILIGMLIRRFEPKLPSQKYIIILSVIGLIGLYFETFFLQKILPPRIGDIILLTIPFATTTFIYFLRLEIRKSSGRRIASLGRIYSLDIYIWHLLIGTILYYILKILTPTIFNLILLPTVIFVTLYVVYGLKRLNLPKLYS